MTSLVIDTSVAVKWLNKDNEKNVDMADKIMVDAKNGKVELLAPELIKYEIGNVLLFSKKISGKDFGYLFKIFYSFPITFVSESEDLSKLTFALSASLGITYYDASFLSIAKQYDATLVTENIKHQGKSGDIKVVPLRDY